MKTILIEARQSLYDIAIQEYGKTDAVVILCQDNNLDYDAELYAGASLLIREDLINEATADVNVVDLFVMRGVQVCTGDDVEDPEILLQQNGDPIEQNNGGAIII